MPKAKTKSPSTACRVCNHVDVGTINLALARGAAVPIIAAKFKGLSTHSLYRHFHRHISGPVLDRLRVKSLAGIVGKNINLAELTASENQAILAQIVALKASLLAGVQAAELANAQMVMSSLVGRVTDLLALEARLLGQITTGSQTTIHNYVASDNFVLVRSLLMTKLRPYPALAREISQALLQIEAPKDFVDVESMQVSGTACEAEINAATVDHADHVVPAIETATVENALCAQADASSSTSLPATSPVAPPVIRLEQVASGATVSRLER
jgi:hypothetical protein